MKRNKSSRFLLMIARLNPKFARKYWTCLCTRPHNLVLLALGISILGGCILPQSEWEDVTSDYESELNTFALISLDENVPTFVQVRRTLGLDGPSTVWTGKDTVWYGDGPGDYQVWDRYESLYGVKDADVIISDGNTEYRFFYVSEPELAWKGFGSGTDATYLDTLHQFHPGPDRTYFLKVETPSGLELTGSVTTPQIPRIRSAETPDTVYNAKTFSVTWDPLKGCRLSIETVSLGSWVCGARQWAVLDEGDSSWTSTVEDCSDRWWAENGPDSILVRLRAMDDNYYQYFIKHTFDVEFVSFLLGGGSSGMSFGVEGGLGVFGAIASDEIYRFLVP